jgi:hypothetical protein
MQLLAPTQQDAAYNFCHSASPQKSPPLAQNPIQPPIGNFNRIQHMSKHTQLLDSVALVDAISRPNPDFDRLRPR